MEVLNFINNIGTESSVIIFVTVCVVIISGVFFARHFQASSKPSKVLTYESCPSPDCFRCAKQTNIINLSYDRFLQYSTKKKGQTYSDEDLGLTRIEHSFHELMMAKKFTEGSVDDHKPRQPQKPVVFSLQDLKSKPYWESLFEDDIQRIQENYSAIQDEFDKVFNDDNIQSLWALNTTPSGNWSVFSLVNQGSIIAQNVAMCPQTWTVVQSLKSVMADSVFGNVVFSVIYPGTVITEHYGPTNTRLRCHLGLHTPADCILTVDGISRSWKEGECLLFDDSFRHSVAYKELSGINNLMKSDADQPSHSPECDTARSKEDYDHVSDERAKVRAVLMIDLWHPALTEQERDALGFAFSTIGTCT